MIGLRPSWSDLKITMRHGAPYLRFDEVVKVYNETIREDTASLLCLMADGRLVSVTAHRHYDAWKAKAECSNLNAWVGVTATFEDVELDFNVLPCLLREATRTSDDRVKGQCVPKHFVYVVQIDSPDRLVKIGYTRNFVARWGNGSLTDNPYNLKVLTVCRGFKSHEQALHKFFSPLRRRGEWYHPGSSLLKFAEIMRGLDLTRVKHCRRLTP